MCVCLVEVTLNGCPIQILCFKQNGLLNMEMMAESVAKYSPFVSIHLTSTVVFNMISYMLQSYDQSIWFSENLLLYLDLYRVKPLVPMVTVRC